MAIGLSTDETRGSVLSRRQKYETVRAALLLERASFDAHYSELAEYLMPRRTRFQVSDRNRGERRSQSIIDSDPRFAARTLQSGMHAGLTSPARPWMKLTTPDPDLAENRDVKKWLHTVTSRMLTVFLRSNLYNALPTLYGDMGTFATGAMGVLEDDEDLLRAYCFPVGSYALGLDARGLATTFTRDREMTVRQLVETFGPVDGNPRNIDWTRFSHQVKDLWMDGSYETAIEVSWFVCPNDTYDASRLESKHSMKWKSCWFERGREDKDFSAEGGGFLRESGFRSFPIMVPRWDVTGDDTYGTDCPGMTALGDVKQLQLMQRNKAKAIAKALDPPLVGSSALKQQTVSLLPGKITYDDGRDGQQTLRPIHEVRLEGLQYLTQDMEETRNRIRRAYYADLFLMLANSDQAQPITAEEVRARQEEKLLALGPVLERTNDELLDPLVDRAFSIMLHAGLVPEPPKALHGVELKVEYLSIMAQAQKLVGVVGQDRFIQSAMGMAQLFPEVRHKVNVFKVIDGYGDMLGVNPGIVRTDEEAQGSLEQEQAAMQRAQEATTAKTEAQAAQALGNTPMDSSQGRTALSAVIDGMGA